MAVTIVHKRAHWFGLTAGPVAWVVSSEFNYAIANWQCDHNVNVSLPVGLILGLLAVAGALVSGRTMRLETGSGRLLGVIGMLLGILSAAIVFTQGAASVVVDACAR